MNEVGKEYTKQAYCQIAWNYSSKQASKQIAGMQGSKKEGK